MNGVTPAAAAAGTDAICRAAEVANRERGFVDRACVVARSRDASRDAGPRGDWAGKAGNTRARRVGHHRSIRNSVAASESITERIREHSAGCASTTVSWRMTTTHVVAEFMREAQVGKTTESTHTESEC